MDVAVPAASAAGLEEPGLTARYWASFVLIVALLVCEIFDFFLVGFLVSAVAPKWGLTYGQSTIILLAAGLGSIFGALGFGWAADRRGRKFAIVGGALVCSLAAGAIALIPERAWLLFAALRFVVGVGYGGAGSSQFALITEMTPTRLRTVMTSSMGVPAGLGVVAASAAVATLFHLLGWRGVAALCAAPAALALVIALVVPESAKWRAAAGSGGKTLPKPPPLARLREALAEPRRFWLIVLIQLGMGSCLTGVLLWGPTITGQLLQVPTQQAAAWFTWVTAAGLVGRVLFVFLPLKLGRVGAGMLMGYGGGASLVLAALFHDAFLGAAPAFLVFLALGELLYDGGFSNVNPYAPELFPVRTAALGTGIASAAGGAGKILGPIALGLIAGAHNLVSPKVTEHAVLPAFLFLGFSCLLAGAAYQFLGVETHQRPLRD